MKTFLLPIAAAAIALAAGGASAKSLHRHVGPRMLAQSESHVQQIPEHIRVPAGRQPEMPKTPQKQNATSSASSAPVTCNEKNASSPACYTATQQSSPAHIVVPK